MSGLSITLKKGESVYISEGEGEPRKFEVSDLDKHYAFFKNGTDQRLSGVAAGGEFQLTSNTRVFYEGPEGKAGRFIFGAPPSVKIDREKVFLKKHGRETA